MLKKTIPILIGLCFIVLQFWPLLHPHKLHQTSGDMAFTTYFKDRLPDAFYRNWDSRYYLGRYIGNEGISLTDLITWIFPYFIGYKLTWTGSVVLFFIFAFLLSGNYLRQPAMRLMASLLLTLSTAYISYVYVGHLGKIEAIAFIPLAYFFLDQYFIKNKWFLLSFAGLSLGLGFIAPGIQSLFYHSVVLAAYFLFKSFMRHYRNRSQRNMKKDLLLFCMVPVLAFLVGLPTLSSLFSVALGARTSDFSISTQSGEKSTMKDYSWATQWSFPPEETLDLFVPGIFGLKSNDPQYPYWGRTGRTPEWTLENRVGIVNFNGAGNYLGLLTFIFILIAWTRNKTAETWFWTTVLGVALLLAYGRFFPLYSLFYQLPLMDHFRNPSKFIHVIHFAGCMLAMQGLVYFEKNMGNYHAIRDQGFHQRLFKMIFFLLAGIGVVLFIALIAFQGSLYSYLSQIYHIKTVQTMLDNTSSSVVRYFIVAGLLLTVLFFITYKKASHETQHKRLIYLLLIIGILDLIHFNSKYLEYQKYPDPREKTKDPLLEFLTKKMQKEPFRVKFIHKGSYLNHFLTLRVPEYGIQSIEPPAESRPPLEFYQGYYKYMNMNALKSYGILNVKYFLSTKPIRHPQLLDSYSFVHPGTRESIYVYENMTSVPKVYAVPGRVIETNTIHALEYMNSSLFNPLKEAVFHTGEGIEVFSEPAGGEWFYEVKNLEYAETQLSFDIVMPRSGTVVIADKYHPAWKAEINGETADIHRVNFFLRGLTLDAGQHHVKLRFAPSLWAFYISIVTWMVVFALCIYYGYSVWNSRKRKI